MVDFWANRRVLVTGETGFLGAREVATLTQRGCQHIFVPRRKDSDLRAKAAIHALRLRVERTFAWEDKFKRLLLRFERLQQRHYGMKVMAYTLINLRAYCGA
jgi:thioester reductase-like protein